MSGADLSDVAMSTLERLRDAIAAGKLPTPITRTSLLACGIHHHVDALEAALSGHSRLACLTILDVALAERRRTERSDPELVWSGPERSHATARDTAVVLRSLFESAQRQVILAGFSFTSGQSILKPLHRVMTERAVDVRFFIEMQQVDELLADPDAHIRTWLAAFLKETWPFGDPTPRIYFDRRALIPGPPYQSLHAKCVVVDAERAFISSANFSMRAQEHNIEAGVLLHDATFAHHLARQWLGLIEAQLVREAG